MLTRKLDGKLGNDWRKLVGAVRLGCVDGGGGGGRRVLTLTTTRVRGNFSEALFNDLGEFPGFHATGKDVISTPPGKRENDAEGFRSGVHKDSVYHVLKLSAGLAMTESEGEAVFGTPPVVYAA
jgi:hypothetical protein